VAALALCTATIAVDVPLLNTNRRDRKMLSSLSLIGLLTLGQAGGFPDAAKAELKLLQGTWAIELQDEDGKELSAAELKGRTICFGMNLFLVRHQATMQQIGKVKIDPAKKTFNATIDKGDHAGDLLPGIYELDGDKLKICLRTDGEGRPRDFKPGKDRLLIVCKRLPAKEGEGDLSGTYHSVSVDLDGRRLKYDVTIERVGECYLVLYTVNGQPAYFGTGVRKGNIFALGWVSQQSGITLYQIEKGNRMVGEFTQVGGPGFLGTETLTRAVLREVNAEPRPLQIGNVSRPREAGKGGSR
jgi:uncharacterized protein (TIGR03067 family)